MHSTLDRAETMMTGRVVRLYISRMRSQTWMPDISGIITSSITRSGRREQPWPQQTLRQTRASRQHVHLDQNIHEKVKIGN